MNQEDEVLDLALEALDAWLPTVPNLIEKKKAAITAIKQSIAAQPAPVQEPVAWRYDLKRNGSFAGVSTEYSPVKLSIGENWTPLYTTPPAAKPAPVQSCYCRNCEAMGKELAALKAQPAQRQWVGLTDEEVYPLANEHLHYQMEGYEVSGIYNLARAIEAKLKEKNT
jgi:hypothetical protein